jgi:hypothetical protein
MTTQQRISDISKQFTAARKLEVEPLDNTLIELVKSMAANDPQARKQANIMWAEYDKEYNATIVSNGTTAQ